VEAVGPPLLIVLGHGTLGPAHDLDQFIALALYLASGFGLALHNLRAGSRVIRLIGMVFSSLALAECAYVLVATWTIAWRWGHDPLVFTSTILVVAPIWNLVAYRFAAMYARRHRRLEGHCIACDYDLRGNRGASTCPECGAATPGVVGAPGSAPSS
jgi:hypothetical protein